MIRPAWSLEIRKAKFNWWPESRFHVFITFICSEIVTGLGRELLSQCYITAPASSIGWCAASERTRHHVREASDSSPNGEQLNKTPRAVVGQTDGRCNWLPQSSLFRYAVSPLFGVSSPVSLTLSLFFGPNMELLNYIINSTLNFFSS